MQSRQPNIILVLVGSALGILTIMLTAIASEELAGSWASGLSQAQCGIVILIVAIAIVSIVVISRVVGPLTVLLPGEPLPHPPGVQARQTLKRTLKFEVILGIMTAALVAVIFCGGLIYVSVASEEQLERTDRWFENTPGFGRPLSAPELARHLGILPGLILPIVGSAGALTALGSAWFRLIPYFKHQAAPPPLEVTVEPSEPTPVEAQLFAQLAAMGFTRLGASVPESVPGAARTWYFTSEDQRVTAATTLPLAGGISSFVFTSFFQDGALLETHSPSGTRVRRPDYIANRIPLHHPAGAHVHHRRSLKHFQAKHGDAVQIASLDDYQRQATEIGGRHEPELREAYSRSLLAPPLAALIANLAALIVMAILYPMLVAGSIACALPFTIMLTYWGLNLGAKYLTRGRSLQG